MHRKKLSLAVNTVLARGREIVQELAATADVFVENFRPGVMAKLGLDYATLSVRNPRLVYVSLSGFGSTGPRSRWGSHGTLIEAASSIEARTAYRDSGPMKLGHPLPDGVGGLAGALAVLRGLRQRDETGSGAYFDLSQMETYCTAGGAAVLAASVAGHSQAPLANRSTWQVPQGVYPCRGDDQWVAITIADDREWLLLVSLLGDESLRSDLFGSPRSRAARQDAIDRAITRFTATCDSREVAAMLQDNGLRAFPILSAAALAADPHLAQRGFFVDVPLDGVVGHLPGFPVVAARALADVRGTAPRLGEHTRLILAEDLGMAPATISELERAGIVANAAG
jgi:crotonobetainyl-CoA:carnitine CoA-transferase CaiB-like acyl-CoA transferase